MINKELKRLNRRELIDVIYQLKKNEEQMQEQIAALEAELQDRRIRISVAGSVAEAAMDITDIFSVAQSTADIYLREIASMKEDAERECEEMIEEAKKKVETIIAEGLKQCGALTDPNQTDNTETQQIRFETEKAEETASEG